MKHLPFVWKNLWRKPIRTIFMFISVVFGFTLWGLVLGFDANLRHIAESANAARIYTSARFGGKLVLAQMQQIAQIRDVSSVGALGAIGGYYRVPSNRVAIIMQGPRMQEVFRDLPLTSRQWAALAGTGPGVFVSRLYAIRYGLETGSSFPIISPDVRRADGSDVWTFRVLAVVPDMPLMPVGFATGSYDYLDRARPGSDRGQVQQFWELARDGAHTDEVAREIDQRFSSSGFPTRSVSEEAVMAAAGGGGSDALSVFISLAFSGIVMVAVLTTNALRHSIRERATELAVMKTMGFSNVKIVAHVLAEAALPCLLGCFFGLAISAGLAAVMPLILPAAVLVPVPTIDFDVVSSGIGAALLVALVAVAGPAVRIARLDVAAALARQ
ncbi:MAG: ABC transporter permease [Steroidobacteraceae bacterium]